MTVFAQNSPDSKLSWQHPIRVQRFALPCRVFRPIAAVRLVEGRRKRSWWHPDTDVIGRDLILIERMP